MDFLSFNELKVKLTDLYKRDVGNSEIVDLIIGNGIQLFSLANGFYAGEYVNHLEKKAIKKIHKDIKYVELFESQDLNSLMFGDLDKLALTYCKSLYAKELGCDGFIFLPKDIYERLITRYPEKEALRFPCWSTEINQYFDQSVATLEVTRNNLLISKSALSLVLDDTEHLYKEDFDDCDDLTGLQRVNRDARDRRGMARILAKYAESLKEDKNYKLKDIAVDVIRIMEEFKVEKIPKVDQIKSSIRWIVDPCARNPGSKKTKGD